MSLITASQLSGYRRSTKLAFTINESLKGFKNESSFLKTKIFMSHKHDEKTALEGAVSFLKNFGVEVYVDWLDEEMPKTTSGETAVRLKEKIRDSHKFIFLATDAALSSKWCNWELGIGDVVKYIDHIAVFPVKSDYSTYTGNEYLNIYPYVFNLEYPQLLNGTFRTAGFYIVYPAINGNNKVVPMSDWLRKN